MHNYLEKLILQIKSKVLSKSILLAKLKKIMPKSSNNLEQAKNYWENNPNAAYSSSQWTSNPIIAENVYLRMSGGQSKKHWLSWVLEDYFAGMKFENILSPGCGVGHHEIIIAKSGIAKSIDAFDFSQASIEIAKKNALNAGVNINFYQDDLNKFIIPDDKKYDVVICSGSLHHVKELERFLALIKKSLKPNGYFIFNEYVGDCYNIYNQRQVDTINRLYKCFSDVLKAESKEEFKNHTIEQAIATDPSECVRSKLILPFVENYFDTEVYHPFGGFLLHSLYPMLNHNQFANSEDAKTSTILRLLLEFEAILMEMPGGLETDFCLSIVRPKK